MSKINDTNPCRFCKSRHQDCHAHCVKYKIFKSLLNEENRKKKKYDEKYKCHTNVVINK